jgi:hypothetical protein
MARGKQDPEFRKIKAEIHKAKEKLRKTERKLATATPKSVASKKVKKLLSRLKSAYLKLGNIEPF